MCIRDSISIVRMYSSISSKNPVLGPPRFRWPKELPNNVFFSSVVVFVHSHNMANPSESTNFNCFHNIWRLEQPIKFQVVPLPPRPIFIISSINFHWNFFPKHPSTCLLYTSTLTIKIGHGCPVRQTDAHRRQTGHRTKVIITKFRHNPKVKLWIFLLEFKKWEFFWN